jgi:hypothetical protein
VVENVRVGRKIKQEVIVALGSFDATWLESFYEGMDASVRVKDWEYWSLRRRTAFWQDVLERMERIGDNRLGADDRKAIRRAIHKVIPWVIEHERKRLDLLEAMRAYEQVQWRHSYYEEDIARLQGSIRDDLMRMEEDKVQSAKFAEFMLDAGQRVAEARKELDALLGPAQH